MDFFVYRIIHTGRSGNWILYLFLHLAVWILVPDYGQVMFWQSGSTAYLWASIPALAVLWLFRINSVSENGFMKSWYAAFPLFLLGVLAGVAMENISAGLLVILTLSLIFFYRNGKLFSFAYRLLHRRNIWFSHPDPLSGQPAEGGIRRIPVSAL